MAGLPMIGREALVCASFQAEEKPYTSTDHSILHEYLLLLCEKWSTDAKPSDEDLSPWGFQCYFRN